MGLVKLTLLAGAGYAVARKLNHHHSSSSHSSTRTPAPNDVDSRPPFRDTKSGYRHQGHCNGDCGRTCNGQQTYGLHDWSCGGQCGGRCETQRRTVGEPQGWVADGAAQSYYAAGGLGDRDTLPSYGRSGVAQGMRAGDVKA